ncbi:MAG: hypothetical protein COT74_04045 [Bdellovibrionales bacterium CG10_big_fil_rev_8_21_14_0_10_45_34]|nr:MAG: hypothetical protein COT74_04045 [Bdellovibrionales bacterium CG10_big_fil_rev_8_21_14_0_10_45_34]
MKVAFHVLAAVLLAVGSTFTETTSVRLLMLSLALNCLYEGFTRADVGRTITFFLVGFSTLLPGALGVALFAAASFYTLRALVESGDGNVWSEKLGLPIVLGIAVLARAIMSLNNPEASLLIAILLSTLLLVRFLEWPFFSFSNVELDSKDGFALSEVLILSVFCMIPEAGLLQYAKILLGIAFFLGFTRRYRGASLAIYLYTASLWGPWLSILPALLFFWRKGIVARASFGISLIVSALFSYDASLNIVWQLATAAAYLAVSYSAFLRGDLRKQMSWQIEVVGLLFFSGFCFLYNEEILEMLREFRPELGYSVYSVFVGVLLGYFTDRNSVGSRPVGFSIAIAKYLPRPIQKEVAKTPKLYSAFSEYGVMDRVVANPLLQFGIGTLVIVACVWSFVWFAN